MAALSSVYGVMRLPPLAFLFVLGCAGAPANVVPSATPLEDQAWTIESYNDGQSLVQWGDVFSMPGWIRFSGGYIDGASGCGGFVGTYTLSENTVSIDVGSILAGSCIRRDGRQPADTSIPNRAVLHALSGTRTISHVEDGWILRDAFGATQAVLTPRD